MISPRIFQLETERGAVSIIDAYLRSVKQGQKILGFDIDEYYWRDVGKPESVNKAASEMRRGVREDRQEVGTSGSEDAPED